MSKAKEERNLIVVKRPEFLACSFLWLRQTTGDEHQSCRWGRSAVRKSLILFSALFLALPVRATVRVMVQDTNGVAWIKYQCTAGEVVRAFALNVSVDRGQIFAVSDFFVGPSLAGFRGYGIFPASFRDHATVNSGTNVTYDLTQYNPLAVPADNPGDTLPGLNSSGVTLELGALWDPTLPSAVPPTNGTLCALHLTRAANVSIAANVSRGGIVLSPADIIASTVFVGAFVDADSIITSESVVNGVLHLTFKGGVLETAPTLSGPWTSTGNSSGTYNETITSPGPKFYRVHHN